VVSVGDRGRREDIAVNGGRPPRAFT